MTQQKPLPIATHITGGFNIASFFHPEVLQWDKIWHMPQGRDTRKRPGGNWQGVWQDCGKEMLS